MSEQIKISIRDFNFFYAKKEVVKALNLDIRENEILSVFGPANSGTTTFAKGVEPDDGFNTRGPHGRGNIAGRQ